MKKRFIFAAMCLTLVFGPVLADLTPIMDIPFDKDGRKWKEGFSQADDEKSITEYVLNNENVENWTELVTVQYFHNVPETAGAFYNRFIGLLKEGVSSKIESRMLSQDKNSVLAEWWVKEDPKMDQHEWIRIVNVGEDLIFYHYVLKNNADVEKRRAVWEDILKNSKQKGLRYSHEDYSFVLPGDWMMKEAKFNELEKKSFEDPKGRISIQDVEVAQIGDKNPEEFIKGASEDLNLWGEFDKYEDLKLDNGQTVKLLLYKPRKKFRDEETITILAPFKEGPKVYLLVSSVTAKDYKTDREELDKVLKSFKVINKKP